MSVAVPNLSLKVVNTIAGIGAAAWDACAGHGNPFVGHAFLAALEASGSVSAKSGWSPHHLVAAVDGRIVACLPLYLKSHSYGEYVFDWAWAEAYERAGGRYYPKLQAAIPFTPVPGPRLLVHPEAPPQARLWLTDGLVAEARRLGVSSAHATFLSGEDLSVLARRGFLTRLGLQYHWTNRGYRTFDDFLATLASRKRKAIRKERASIADSGIVLRTLSGTDIGERHWDAFYRFYRDTADRKWGHAYLTRAFFFRLGEVMADRVVLILAETALGRPIGAALNLLGEDTLYGRSWGCDEQYRFLHFEACYYRAIDFAIAHGLARVEAGAQGEHKLQRGYLPVPTYSAHWLSDPGFARAVAHFLAEEQAQTNARIAALSRHSPYREGEGGSTA